MNSIEITAVAGSILVVLAALFYALYRQCGTIRQQEHAIGMYRQALDDERKAHAKTNARLVEEMRLHKERYL